MQTRDAAEPLARVDGAHERGAAFGDGVFHGALEE